MNYLSPPNWAPNSIATEFGWVNPKTGELLVSIKNLPNQVKEYKRNQRVQRLVIKNENNNFVKIEDSLLQEEKEINVPKKLAGLNNNIWITDGIKNNTIKKDMPIPEGWKRGRVGAFGKKVNKKIETKIEGSTINEN